MILFSSFSHIWVLLLFMYLGLSSGIIFFSASIFLDKLKMFLLRPKQKKERKIKSYLIIKKDNKIEDNNFSNLNSSNNNEALTPNKKNRKLFHKNNNKNLNNSKQKKSHKKSQNIFLKVKLGNFFKGLFLKLSKIKGRVINTSFTIVKILVFLIIVVVSYLINLYLNMGYLRVGFVIVFVGCFMLAKSVIKMLAIYLVNFYNCFKRKLNKQK